VASFQSEPWIASLHMILEGDRRQWGCYLVEWVDFVVFRSLITGGKPTASFESDVWGLYNVFMASIQFMVQILKQDIMTKAKTKVRFFHSKLISH